MARIVWCCLAGVALNTDYIVLAIPIFFLLIGVELLVARWQGKRCYRLSDSINDLSCGMLQQLALVFTRTALIARYSRSRSGFVRMSPSCALM